MIDELARIDEILNLSEILQQPTEVVDHFGISMCFEESFIDSHEMLVMLRDRVTSYWNKNSQQDMQKLHKADSRHPLECLDVSILQTRKQLCVCSLSLASLNIVSVCALFLSSLSSPL